MDKIRELWAEKKTRQIVVLGLIGAAVVFIALSMTDDTNAQLKEIERMQAPTSRDGSFFSAVPALQALSDRDAQSVVDKMSSDMQAKERELNRREAEMQRTTQQLTDRQQELERQLFEQRQQMLAFSRGQGTVSPDQGGARARTAPQQQSVVQPSQPAFDAQGNRISQGQTQIITQNPAALTGGQVIRTVTQRNVREFRDGKVNERPVEIHTLNARNQRVQPVPVGPQAKLPLEYEEDEGVEIFTLSMGSIISGTLLNGVAAPTSSDRKQDPMPVLMRVRREALMPNSFTLDIVDCHLLGSAIGDLSSNRAYIRAEAISCNTSNGEAIEKTITAYAVSSTDGMAGIQGDVVFKSGAMIANSMKAEFIRGFADAFSPQRVQSLNTSPGASELWQTQNIDRAAGAGIGQGFSGAASRIADYYMSMAEASHPVIELVPGIEVDFIVQRGMSLRLGGRQAPFTGNRMGERDNAGNIVNDRTGPSVNVTVN
ncbi:TrbI/VirB10 family protein [Rheinheimera sp.]|uniref:TrbI/VirB10 family protein n=1 Tax=Rheinheimera sp. TaxID=1869214 RepID=UPI004047A257